MKQNFSKYLNYNEYLNDVEAGMFNDLSSSIQFIEDRQNDVIKIVFRQGLLTSSKELLSIDYRNIINTELDKSIDYWVANNGEKIYELFSNNGDYISLSEFDEFIAKFPNYFLRPVSAGGVISGYEDLPLGKINMTEYNIPAEGTIKYEMYNESEEHIADVRISSIFKNNSSKSSTYLYSIGCLSDLHHNCDYDNDYYENGGVEYGPQSATDLNNALNYFEHDANVKFVAITGDLTEQQEQSKTAFIFNTFSYENGNELSNDLDDITKNTLLDKGPVSKDSSKVADLDSFKYNAFEKISPNTPIFVARGNHDIGALRAARSVELINRNSYDFDTSNGGHANTKMQKLWAYYTHPSNNKTIPSSLHIVYQYPDEGNDKANCDNYYIHDTDTDDVYIFFSLYNNDFWYGRDPYKTEDFVWLCETLDEFRNKRTFVFLHLFFDDKCGAYKHIYPNWQGGSNSPIFINTQYLRLQWLSDYYKNSIWISGHSHWRWCSQAEDINANVYHKSVNPELGEYGGWCIHLPSCAYPRTDNGNGTSQDAVYSASEGAVIDIYEDYIEIHGIVFKDAISWSESSRLSNTTPQNSYINYKSGIANYRFNIGGKNLTKIDSLI